MKYVIDMGLLAKELQSMPSDARSSYVMNELRALHIGEIRVDWASKHKTSKALPKKYSDSFEKFWNDYPRKTGKGGAWKAWWKASDHGDEEETLLGVCSLALAWQKEAEQWTRDEGQFVPHAQTWLNQRRWEDEDPNAGKGWEEYLTDSGEVKRRRIE